MNRALMRNRNFRILVAGQWVSSIGNNLFELAVFWFVLSTTHRPSNLGLVGTAMALPGVLGLFSGVLVDRTDRRLIMIVSDLIRAALALLLGLLASLHLLSLALFLILVLILMAVGTLFNPAAMALVPQIVGAEHLPDANGVLESALQSASLVGLLAGGMLMAALGPILLFIANGVSFLVSVASLLVLRTPPHESPRNAARPGAANLLRDWREGLRTLWSVPVIRAVIVVGVIVNFIFQGITVLAAAWVKGPLHGNAFDYALMGMAVSVGVILGGLLSARFLRLLPLAWAFPLALGLMGTSIVVMSRWPVIWVTVSMMVVLGINEGVLNTGIMTTVQTATPPGMMGRAFGSLGALLSLATPLGAAFYGGLSGIFSLAFIFMLTGLTIAVVAAASIRWAGRTAKSTMTPEALPDQSLVSETPNTGDLG
jgi:MFS family permease